MDFFLDITEYITDLGYTPAFIVLLGMIIFIGALKVIKVSRETIKNSNKLYNESVGSVYQPLIEENDFIEKNLDKIHREQSEILNKGEVSIANLKENESIEISNSDIENTPPDSKPDKDTDQPLSAFYFEPDQETEQFQLFTNPKHIFSGALKEIFLKKLKIVLNNMPVYRLTRFPFFKNENNSIIKFFLDEKPELLIEELFELWRMGYNSNELPLLFIHYFFSIKSDLAVKILKSILNHKLLSDDDVQKILFLYSDALGLDDKINYKAPSLENGYDAFLISDFIDKNKIILNRNLWQKWENDFFNQVNEDQKGRFYLFYFNKLEENTSFMLKYILLNKYKHILTRQWREYIEKQAFYHGHYDKLNRLSFIPPEYSSLITKSPLTSKRQLQDLLQVLNEKKFADLHKFLVLHINKLKELRNYNLSESTINLYLDQLHLPVSDNNYLPQSIRFLLFLYFYIKNDLNKMNLLIPYIKGNIGRFIPRLYQLRLIFKNQEYQRAYEEIKDLWNNDEDNMLLMNEMAIYAYHAGKIDEAEEYFSRLREIYPHNSQILHNESIFLKFKSRMLAEKHRKQEEFFEKKPAQV